MLNGFIDKNDRTQNTRLLIIVLFLKYVLKLTYVSIKSPVYKNIWANLRTTKTKALILKLAKTFYYIATMQG